MKIPIVTIALLFQALQVYSQLNLSWDRKFNGFDNIDDYPIRMQVDSSGNVYILGATQRNYNPTDIILIKYDLSGTVLWQKQINTRGGYEEPADMKIDKDCNIYILTVNLNYVITIKFDTFGNLVWIKKTYTEINSYLTGTKILFDRNYNPIIIFYTLENLTLVKYSANGELNWFKKFTDFGYDFLYCSDGIIDNDNNICVTGSCYFLNSYDDLFLMKFSPSGDSLWFIRYNTSQYDHGVKLAIDSYDNIYVAGRCEGSPFNYANYVYTVIKYSPGGTQQWIRRYTGGGVGSDIIFDITCDNENNIYVTGYSYFPDTKEDYVTIKYNPNGDSLWTRRYNGSLNDTDNGKALEIDKDGNVFVTGISKNSSTYDLTTLIYSSYGNLLWVENYNNIIHKPDYYPDYINMIYDPTSLFINTTIFSLETNYDILTLKYNFVPIGIKPISSQIPSKFSLSQNYPNPFNPNSKIKFQIAKISAVKLVVYDILGREMQSLVNEQLKPGVYETELNGSNLASGLYFYQLTADDFSETRKMILIK